MNNHKNAINLGGRIRIKEAKLGGPKADVLMEIENLILLWYLSFICMLNIFLKNM